MVKSNLLFALFLVSAILLTCAANKTKYEPTWESLDQRPLPQWYDEAKFGIFLHWGVYSVPSFHSEWMWESWIDGDKHVVEFMKQNYPPNFTYQDFASQFKAELFNPQEWAQLFKRAGAQYVTLTSKHHEGYCMWPSPRSFSWNSMDVGPKKDLIKDLAKAVRGQGLRFGLYYSLFEWFNPIYLSDKNATFKTNEYVKHKMYPEMINLVERYKPELWWSDGDGGAPDSYWMSKNFIAWLYNDSPVKDSIVVNDRWGYGIPCKHGGFWTCRDSYDPGHLIQHKWESASTIDSMSWGYRRNANLRDIYTTEKLIHKLVRTVSCGGNFHLNVGPTVDGRIDFLFQERLLEIGDWLKINGEAIYKSKPWVHQNDTIAGTTWYTFQPTAIYAITPSWPSKNKLKLASILKSFQDGAIKSVTLLGNSKKLKYTVLSHSVVIQFPDKATVASKWAWTLKFATTKSD